MFESTYLLYEYIKLLKLNLKLKLLTSLTQRILWFEKKSFFTNNRSYAYEMNQESSVDIDVRLDYLFAKYLIEADLLSWGFAH